jgi:hypothetical protein
MRTKHYLSSKFDSEIQCNRKNCFIDKDFTFACVALDYLQVVFENELIATYLRINDKLS